MTDSHDPLHAPEHHGLGPVKGGRLLFLVVVAVSLVALVAVWRACSGRGGPEGASPVATEGTVTLGDAVQKQAGISTDRVKRLTRTDRVEAPGVLALDEKRTARLGSLVDGLVIKAHAEVGDRVRQGQVLAEMHSHVVHDAWADYRKAVADRRRRETEQTFARQNEERAKRLLEQKAISRHDLQRAEADRVAADEQLDMARTEVRRAEEALEHFGVTNAEDPSGESGEYIPVRTPLDGVVLEKSITQGTAVTLGAPLFVVANLAELWAVAEIDETQIPLVRTGLPTELRVAAYPGETFAGRITFVADTVNPKTRRVTVRCQVPNPGGRLKPEMYAAFTLSSGEPHEVLAVPSGAVQEIEGKPFVFVKTASGTFERRDVALGQEAAGWVEVRSGVKEGEEVAVSGSFLLKSELLEGALAGEE
ncbi:MAG: efflux RND transporter periplasmic adaptor subunit [Vicinamibacteria bacterium]|nr:efflux RND transporter periplasmic adaptor subunit [Vicinamibacteria bacterium]